MSAQRLVFEVLQDDDLGFEFAQGLGCGRLVEDLLFGGLGLLARRFVDFVRIVARKIGCAGERRATGLAHQLFLAQTLFQPLARRSSERWIAAGEEARRRCRICRAKPTLDRRLPSPDRSARFISSRT